jgi:hypothetical protein
MGGLVPGLGTVRDSPDPSYGHESGFRLVGECLFLFVLKDVVLGGTMNGIL